MFPGASSGRATPLRARDRCGHCQKLAPEYKKAAKSLEGTAKLVAVDCDEQKQLCSEAGVKGFPTLKVRRRRGPAPPGG